MAEAPLSSFLEVILGNLASAALQELRMVWGVDEELDNLKSNLLVINAVLEDAEERQVKSERIRDWFQNVKYVAYDADDLIDEIVTESRQSKTAENGTEGGDIKKKMKLQVVNIVSSCFHCNRILHRREMAVKIREINVQLEKITRDMKVLQLQIRDQPNIVSEARTSKLVSSVRDESSQFLGREDDTEKIVNFLLSDDSSKRNISVIAIVGMGGVGKTTLAGVVYNDKRITENFEIRAWVCVSEHFTVERLTKAIIASVSSSTCDLLDFDSQQRCLRDKLNGKKFLLVFDDVWGKDYGDWERWEQLKAPLTFGAKGSRIVVTTRSQVVSNTVQATCIHGLKCLSKQDCWSLFVGQAFKDESIDAYPGLVKIGEELVNKCGGLPLAAKALGGLLSSKREVRDWETILRSPIWGLEGPASSIIPALRVSYQHLPAHLKRCFTFCSVFPKDYEFCKEKLVLQWVAHGFVTAKEGKQMEDTGSEYFNHLLQRSFFQLDDYDEIEALTAYKMHDLIHDLAQSISGDECFHVENGQPHGVLGKTRHLSCSADHSELINFESFDESKGLRTFILVNALQGIDEKVPHEIFERLRFIRVLDLNRCKITELPRSISNLKHLRYLDLSESKIKKLPESICSIYNMQTLLLRNCRYLVMLPNETRKLINLRHLDIEGCDRLLSMPPQIGRLTCLQTLPFFCVGTDRERGISELKELTGIRGELGIDKLENVAEAEDAREANLKSKSFLDGLQLMWSADRSDSLLNQRLEKEIANELQPHRNLKTLEFWNYMGTQFPSWMVEMDMLKLLSNLRSLELWNCSRCSILPPLGCLPSLSNLRVCNMEQVKRIGREFYGMAADGFPSLKELHLERMLNLEEWQLENQGDYFPCLERLFIRGCPHLRQMPNFNALPNLTYLDIVNCASLVSLPRPPSLKKLFLWEMENLEEWCEGEARFPHLQKLSIIQCPKMRRWPVILPVLTELSVQDSQGLNELPSSLSVLELRGVVSQRLLNSMSCLTSLSSLTIDSIPSITSMPQGMLQGLTQLKELRIWSCNELVTLEDEVLPLNLTHLCLYDCLNLKSLPRALHALTSLRHLLIHNCPSITSLPEQGLPPTLQSLMISACPALKARYLKDVGEGWPRISHIPHVDFTWW